MGGTRSSAISTPRSPRATMTPSASSRISSMWSQAAGFSILATTRAGFRPMCRRSAATSAELRTNDSATKSTPVEKTKFEVRQIFLRQRRRADIDARQVDALIAAHGSARDDFEAHAHAVARKRAKFDRAI